MGRDPTLDNFQPSLAGLNQVASCTQDWRPGLSSAVPAGLSLEMEFSHGQKSVLFTRFLQDKILDITPYATL
jgi:hypothetical protein